MNDCTSICKTWHYRPGPGNPGVGCGKVESPPWLKKTPNRRSVSTSIKNQAVNLHCPQTWLSSCLGERTSSDTLLLPLLQQGLFIHHGLTMKKAPNAVPPPTGGARPKIWWSTTQPWSRPDEPDPVSHPCRWIHVEMLRTPTSPSGEPWCPVAGGQCSLTSYVRTSMNLKPFAWLIGM